MKILPRLLAAALALFATPALAAPLIIGGAIVTPAGVRPHAWLVIDQGRIQKISDSKPAIPGAKTLETTDLVFPGFVDLHNHPLWAVFERFHPATPPSWPNRYAWRADARYLASLQNPWWDMMTHGAFCDLDEYAELQALIGGTTAILGLDLVDDTKPAPGCIRGLARNLDYASGFHGAGTSNEAIAWVLGVTSDMKPDALNKLHRQMAHGDLDAVIVHTAEGQRNDAESRTEFGKLKSLNLLEARTSVVHGVALTAADFGDMAKVGAGLIWSPRSNMELYHQMPDLAAARKAGVTIALAPDWAPTGSTNMLGEIAYADAQHQGFSRRQLFDMATAIPAKLGRIDDKVGAIAAGHYADLFLLKGDARDPYTALAMAKPQDVTLTMVNGQPLYGAPDHLAALGVMKTESFPQACGAARAFNSAALPKPFAKLQADLAARMTAHGLKLAPLVYCH
jgi:cytosine/adenosine deaminase-related metal-dependent hydrolase